MQLKTIKEFIDHSSLDMDHKLWVSENSCSSLLPEAYLMKSFLVTELTEYLAEKHWIFTVHIKLGKVE